MSKVKIMPECTVKSLLIANYKINRLKFTQVLLTVIEVKKVFSTSCHLL